MALTLRVWSADWAAQLESSSTDELSTGVPSMTFDAPRVVIGRSEGCELWLPDASVSHRHASIRQRGPEYLLLDEGSTNGTVIERVRLTKQSPRVLRSGDRIRIGRFWIEAEIEVAMPSHPREKRGIAMQFVLAQLAADGEDAAPQLVAGGTRLRLDDGASYAIGRGRDVALALDGVARRHAEVSRQGDAIRVRPLGSSPVFIGEHLVSDKGAPWKPGQTLHVGDHEITLAFEALEILAETEHAADEKLAESSIPPCPWEDEEEEEILAPPDATLDDDGTPSPVAPVVVSYGTAAETVRGAPDDARWRWFDVLVVLIALGVLGVSGAGLVFLMNSWA